MDLLFLICAIFGGTFLVAQFLLGLGGDHDAGADGPDDAPDGDMHAVDGHDGASDHHHNSTWVFGVLSIRTVLIGLTFFGLTGKASSASGFEPLPTLAIAIACGLGAMYGVYFLMRGLFKLTADGTARIERTVGEEGMVYLPIPANNSGIGKVHVPVQNRLVEYEAMTSGERLPSGTRIVVVSVLGSDRVEVEPIIERARNTRV